MYVNTADGFMSTGILQLFKKIFLQVSGLLCGLPAGGFPANPEWICPLQAGVIRLYYTCQKKEKANCCK